MLDGGLSPLIFWPQPGLQGGQGAHYATLMVWTATNSDSNLGSPSSRSRLTLGGATASG